MQQQQLTYVVTIEIGNWRCVNGWKSWVFFACEEKKNVNEDCRVYIALVEEGHAVNFGLLTSLKNLISDRIIEWNKRCYRRTSSLSSARWRDQPRDIVLVTSWSSDVTNWRFHIRCIRLKSRQCQWLKFPICSRSQVHVVTRTHTFCRRPPHSQMTIKQYCLLSAVFYWSFKLRESTIKK